jgi:hypothetical protein
VRSPVAYPRRHTTRDDRETDKERIIGIDRMGVSRSEHFDIVWTRMT